VGGNKGLILPKGVAEVEEKGSPVKTEKGGTGGCLTPSHITAKHRSQNIPRANKKTDIPRAVKKRRVRGTLDHGREATRKRERQTDTSLIGRSETSTNKKIAGRQGQKKRRKNGITLITGVVNNLGKKTRMGQGSNKFVKGK